ncbi:MAG: metal-dependent hydrolase [Candidatus Hodarchaeota archaeon]
MKNITHYLFSIGLLNLVGLIFIKDPLFSWVYIFLSFVLSGFSLLPNWLDKFTGTKRQYEGVQLRRHRHPSTHSPWTIGYFIPPILIGNKISNPLFEIIILSITISWLSHFLLDALNPEGIPLGLKSTVSNHSVKHYLWLKPSQTRKVVFARNKFNDLKVNKFISCIGLFLFSLNFSNLLLNHTNVIFEVVEQWLA